MNKEKLEELNKLFNKFSREESGVSSFALENLLNKVIAIVGQEDSSNSNNDN